MAFKYGNRFENTTIGAHVTQNALATFNVKNTWAEHVQKETKPRLAKTNNGTNHVANE